MTHFQTPSFLQKAIERFEKIEKILHINDDIPGKLINSSEMKAFEFSMSNKKWLLLGNYKPP